MLATEKVLFVEDNDLAAMAGTAMLEICGYEVVHVVTAEDGLEAFQTKSFALVFSDICLPGKMSGLDLAAAIRRQRPATPIILATGYSDQADRAAREFIVLQKPYDVSQFRSALRHVTTGTH